MKHRTLKKTAREIQWTFAGNDREGKISLIVIKSISMQSAESQAKAIMSNARLMSFTS